VLHDYEKADWTLEQALIRALQQIDGETNVGKSAESG
jgi:hypothetical protein